MLNIEEAIEAWKDFESRANEKRGTQIDRIKEDRTFLSGEQWDNDDARLIDNTRVKRTVNVLGNSINATSNVYAAYPFKWYSRDEETDAVLESFLKTGSNARAAQDVLYSNVAFGLGYFGLGSETVTDVDGTEIDIPALYAIEKVENVYFDPDSVEIDGRDAVEAAVVEYRSKNWVRAKYGEEFVTDKGIRPMVNTTANVSNDMMVIVTYFRVNGGRCEIYQMLNDKFLTQPATIEISRPPIYPVYGERTWEGEDIVWQGLVRKGRPIQKVLNFCFTQLCERLAKCPKNVIITTPQAVDGYVEGYRNFDRNINPLLMYNATSPDGKVKYDMPQRADMRVPFDDIVGIIGSQLDLLSTITGVDAKGQMLGEVPQKTATEVLYNERQTQCTIRHFYANLKCTFKAIGEDVARLIGLGKVPVDVIQGPSDGMQLQVARQELMQLMGMVPEDKRMQLVNGIFLTHPDNPVLANVFGSINMQPGPTPMEMQQQDVIEQMRQAIGQKDQEIQQMQEQIKQYEFVQQNNERDIRSKFIELDVKHQQKMEEMALQAQLEQGTDAERAAIDAQKGQMELEKQAIALDATKVKAAGDMLKTFQSLSQPQPQPGERKPALAQPKPRKGARKPQNGVVNNED